MARFHNKLKAPLSSQRTCQIVCLNQNKIGKILSFFPPTFVHFTKRPTFVFILIYPSYSAWLFYLIYFFTAADRARVAVVTVA